MNVAIFDNNIIHQSQIYLSKDILLCKKLNAPINNFPMLKLSIDL